MFGRDKDLVAKLREQGGVEAPATITDAAILWTSQGHTNSADIDAPGDTKHCEVTIKVTPEAEAPFEEKFKQTFPDHIPHPGQQAKVIYDPDKHSKIAIVDGTMSWGRRTDEEHQGGSRPARGLLRRSDDREKERKLKSTNRWAYGAINL